MSGWSEQRFHEGVEIIGCTCCELPDYQKLEEAASVPARAPYQCGLPRPSTTAPWRVLPNFFPMAFWPICCPTTQPGPSAYGMTPIICHGNPSARVCWLCFLAKPCLPWTSACTCSPTSQQQSSAQGLHNPEATAFCSWALPRSSGPIDCLTTLCSSGILPSPSPTSCHYQCELSRPSPIQCCWYNLIEWRI